MHEVKLSMKRLVI